jgi:predicted Zn finger-like uncharacterized protein
MPLKTVCPKCQTGYLLEDAQAGKTVRCRKCQAAFTVEPPPAPRRAEPLRGRPGRRYHDEPDEAPPRRARGEAAPALGGALPWVIGGGAVALLILLLLGGAALVFALRGAPGAPAGAPADPEPPPALVNGQLPPEVLKKVKRGTAFLRVTQADGDVGMGSGFAAAVEGERGLVLTNAHVVGMLEPRATQPPRSIEVVFNSGEADERKLAARVLGVDRSSDLAVLRINGDRLPEPLEVKSARNLVETQEVFVFGFPLGDLLGKEITVNKSSVASLRKEHGVLNKVQVHGGMNPGNSGGPVVDGRGDVIGVAVSGIRTTQINFAVPGDYVHVILNGRIAEMGLARARPHAGGLVVPVTMQLIDPLGRIKNVALDVWSGDAGADRPPATERPAPAAGDSEHQTVVLTYDRARAAARGEMTLAPLPPGKVYWIQPNYVNGAGASHWATAHVAQIKQ